MNNAVFNFNIEDYKQECIKYCIDTEYTPKSVKVVRYLLADMVYDHAKKIAICICNQENLKNLSKVSRMTISKTINKLIEEGIIYREHNVMYFNLGFKRNKSNASD